MDIRELRKEKGWSQSDLSDLTGLSARTIHRIENGQVKPSVESAKALAAVFKFRPINEIRPIIIITFFIVFPFVSCLFVFIFN